MLKGVISDLRRSRDNGGKLSLALQVSLTRRRASMMDEQLCSFHQTVQTALTAFGATRGRSRGIHDRQAFRNILKACRA